MNFEIVGDVMMIFFLLIKFFKS